MIQASYRRILAVVVGIASVSASSPNPTLSDPNQQGAADFYTQQHDQSKVVGGEPAVENQFPWMVAISKGRVGGPLLQYCGGALISSQWVVTAAHCHVSKNHVAVLHRLDLTRRGPKDEEILVDNVIPRDGFNSTTFDYDVALLHLATPSDQKPIDLIDSAETHAQSADTLTFAGWGKTSENGTTFSDILLFAVAGVYDQHDCARIYNGFRDVTPRMLCALNRKYKDTCQGDSGGPLVTNDSVQHAHRLAGVISWGKGCANPDYPGVYTRIGDRKIRCWIFEQTGLTRPPGDTSCDHNVASNTGAPVTPSGKSRRS